MKQFEPITTSKSSRKGGDKQPKYLRAAEQIRKHILSGVFRPGDQLPSERDLAQFFEVAYLTVRQALHHLIQEGFVERKHGKGTFVIDRQSHLDAKGAASEPTAPIYLLGLGPQVDARHDPVNWEIHLFRYQGIVEGGFHYGYPIEVPSGWSGQLSEDMIKKIATGSGVILSGDQLDEKDIARLVEEGVRVVAINRHRGLVCSEVQVDTKQGTVLAVEHLLQLGHRRIGIIAGDQKKPLMQLRLQGYKDALSHYDVPFREELMVVDPRGKAEDGAAALEKFLRSDLPPTAIFTTSDRRAVGVLARARELGRSVPEQLSVVGFDDLQMAGELDPPLTTVHNPIVESGVEAVRLIHEHLRHPELDLQLVRLPMTLTVRSSTARLRSEGNKAGRVRWE